MGGPEGSAVGEVLLGCILVPLKGSDSAGPLSGARGGVVSQRKGAAFLWEPPALPVQILHHFPTGP